MCLSQRGRVYLLILLLLLATGLTVAWKRSPQAQVTTVAGRVDNGTAGADVPSNLAITLHLFSGMEETDVYTTTVTAEGVFQFEEVPLEEEQTVIARAVHGGVTYVSEFKTIENLEEELSLPVTIYEATEDPAEVMVAQLHLFLNPVGGRIQIGEYAVIANTGERTYVGSEALLAGGDQGARTTWTARLPEGAENLAFDNGTLGGRFVPVEGGFADTRAVPPGDASVETSFTYELALQEGVEIAQSFDLPVRAVVVVMPEGEWGVEGPTISAEDTLDTQMGAALSYSAGPLAAGEPLSFVIVPREASLPPATDQRSSNEWIVGLAALLAAGIAVVLMWRSPSSRAVPAEVRSQVEAIAALDRDFEKGRLPEETYREKRRSLKREVRETLSNPDL